MIAKLQIQIQLQAIKEILKSLYFKIHQASLTMKNIKCAFHTTENIVNFCRNDECLLPMCPTCVKVHSKEHMAENTHGQYENIVDVYAEVEKNLKDILQSLASCGDDLKEGYQQKQYGKELMRKKMQEMKTKILDSIGKYIDTVQKEIIHSVQTFESTIDENFNVIDEKIQLVVLEVKRELELLQGDKTLKTMIGHFSQEKEQFYQSQLYDISAKISQMNTLNIAVSKQFKISQMTDILKNIKSCYRSVFIQTLERTPLRSIKLKDSQYSKESLNSKMTFKENQNI